MSAWDNMESGGKGAEKSGKHFSPKTPGKDAGLYHRVSEERRKGVKRYSSVSVERLQGSEQIRSLFLDPLGACGTFMCEVMKMWVDSLGGGLELG